MPLIDKGGIVNDKGTTASLQDTPVAVNIYADADPQVLKESYGMLHLCTYLGSNGIQIVDAK